MKLIPNRYGEYEVRATKRGGSEPWLFLTPSEPGDVEVSFGTLGDNACNTWAVTLDDAGLDMLADTIKAIKRAKRRKGAK